MDLTSHVDNLRREFAAAADLGGPEARALAERLSGPLGSAIRLAILDALSAAADEITRDLAPGSVELRLRGREAGFVVTPSPGDPSSGERVVTTPESTAPPETDDGAMSRINFRLPDHLKSRIEDAAGREGLSVNAWLVRAAAAAVQFGAPSPDPAPGAERRTARGKQHYTGWVR